MNKTLKTIAAIMLMALAVIAAGCGSKSSNKDAKNSGVEDAKVEKETVADPGEVKSVAEGDVYNGHAFVNLGLPSGTLWATCNVGADKPEGYGDYFAWGETTVKPSYDWANYKYCEGGESNQLTKYCSSSEEGFKGFNDKLETLDPTDDAATANWGEGWCMPTETQWRELLDNTTCNWTTLNGIKGRLMTASNGGSLFLPAAGFRSSELQDVEKNAFYWSSSLCIDVPSRARYFYFYDSEAFDMDEDARYYGYSVRAVRSKE